MSKEKICVVRIIARLNIGGPAKQALFLTRGLSDRCFQSCLITGMVGSDEVEIESVGPEQNDQIFIVPTLGRDISWVNDVLAFVALFKILRRIQPDIVHTHTAKAGTLGRLAAILARVPIKVHTFHGHVFKDYFGTLKTALFIIIERTLAYFTDRIIVLSDSQCEEIIHDFKIAPREKARVIPLGFNLAPFVSTGSVEHARGALGIASKAFVVGFVGRLVAIKNPLLLLQAFYEAKSFYQTKPSLRDEPFPPWYLIVAGGGQLLNTMQTDARTKKLSDQVIFCGWQQEVRHIYAAVTVVVLTSLNEGTPVALIEAMASGKPFIATNVGGVVDLMVGAGTPIVGENGGKFTIYENGILVDSQDVVGLTGALLHIMTHSHEAQEMGRVGSEYSQKVFDQKRLLADIKQLYQDLFGEKGLQ